MLGTDHGVEGFGHEALLYDGIDDFLHEVVPFVAAGVAAGQAVLVAVDAEHIDGLRERLGVDAGKVRFENMSEVGRNPACVLPMWREFVSAQAPDRPVRGVGEPVWPGRSADEIDECERHEALLNHAFADGPAWRLLCPYDRSALQPSIIDTALRTHPVVGSRGERSASDHYRNGDAPLKALSGALPEPPEVAVELAFGPPDLTDVRSFVSEHALGAGLDGTQAAELVVAVHELATNSVRHGGGEGNLRVWTEGHTVVCEVRDSGRIAHPLVGRERPDLLSSRGRGLWVVNRFCDLVRLRSSEEGTTVRVHKSTRDAPRPRPS